MISRLFFIFFIYLLVAASNDLSLGELLAKLEGTISNPFHTVEEYSKDIFAKTEKLYKTGSER